MNDCFCSFGWVITCHLQDTCDWKELQVWKLWYISYCNEENQ